MDAVATVLLWVMSSVWLLTLVADPKLRVMALSFLAILNEREMVMPS